MLRAVALLLLAANVLFFAFTHGWLADVTGLKQSTEREPERLGRQVRPEAIRVLKPVAASQALAASAAASSPQAALTCLEAGPLDKVALATTQRALSQAGLPTDRFDTLDVDMPGAWLVYIGRYADRSALERRVADLERRSIKFDVVTEGELHPGISLGRFDDRAQAETMRRQLVQQGIKSARVVTLRTPGRAQVLRVDKADGALAAQLKGLDLPSGVAFTACVARP
ncbi:MAG TPA: SPOR domain-containing protein [Burkholderiaceae bacterium]|nr:SPOR domain-containing protein [Burkholderiaceae bacterium]